MTIDGARYQLHRAGVSSFWVACNVKWTRFRTETPTWSILRVFRVALCKPCNGYKISLLFITGRKIEKIDIKTLRKVCHVGNLFSKGQRFQKFASCHRCKIIFLPIRGDDFTNNSIWLFRWKVQRIYLWRCQVGGEYYEFIEIKYSTGLETFSSF